MDWDKLRIFHAVAKAGSFTHASEMLHSSQSAVSRQISSLEETLGVALFHRHARGLILTEQGEMLYETAREIAQKLGRIEGRIGDSKTLGEGPLIVTMPDFVGSTLLAPKIAQFRDAHPHIQLTILFDDRILNLGMREADCALRLHKPEQQNLIQRHLTSLKFLPCASHEYLKEYGEPEDITSLQNHRFIGYPEKAAAPYNHPNWFLEAIDCDPTSDNVMLINSLLSILRATESNAGISALPDYIIHESPHLKPILPQIKRDDVRMYFVYPEERRNSKRIAIFRDFLVENIKKDTTPRI